jgi:hypothetical protein
MLMQLLKVSVMVDLQGEVKSVDQSVDPNEDAVIYCQQDSFFLSSVQLAGSLMTECKCKSSEQASEHDVSFRFQGHSLVLMHAKVPRSYCRRIKG